MITGVILAHNEAVHIRDCIAALRPHVGELLLIDTESTDQTVELARPLVDRILSHPNVPNFDAVRNIAIPVARHDWLWFVDADERIPERTGWLVNDLIRNRGHEFEAINIPFKSHFCGQWMQHCGWWPGYTVCRVLKRGHFEFGRILHSGVSLRGREIRFPPDPELAVPHYSFRNLEHYVAKFNRYTSTEAAQLQERGIPYDWRMSVRIMVRDLWEHYELHDARRDGSLGWILTWMAGQYRWMSQTKLIDLQPRSDIASAPASLDEFLLVMEQDLAMFRARRPQFPLGIVVREGSNLATQHPEKLASFARSLATLDRELLVESSAEVIQDAPPADRGLLRALSRAHRPRYSAALVCGDSQQVPQLDPSAVINLLLVDESLIAPSLGAEWIAAAKQFDELWVASRNQCVELRRSGIAPEKMRILPCFSVPAAEILAEHGDPPAAPELSAEFAAFVDARIVELERRLAPIPAAPAAAGQIRVQWEGELFAGHSFANVNENLLNELTNDPSLAISIRRMFHNPAHDRLRPLASELLGLVDRELTSHAEIIVRHTFPPNWTPPEAGLLVHIQPWEFGHLPLDWLPHLRDRVDEIWAPSNYVRNVYVQSGVAPEKIQVIPWGVNPETFRPFAPRLTLPTAKSFRFLFVGGVIPRKGFDRVLTAFLEEFGPADDVCLVVKDLGAHSFYPNAPAREQVLQAAQDANGPGIVYIDEDFSEGQMASLYCACDSLVAPYRGEGFGLPVLEAAACGLAAIVPRGGPTDDFLNDESAYILDSRTIENPLIPGLCKIGTEFEVSIADLRRIMREAASDRNRTRSLGANASRRVRGQFTWAATAELVKARLEALANRARDSKRIASFNLPRAGQGDTLSAAIWSSQQDPTLANALCRIQPFVHRLFVVDRGMTEQNKVIAREYGASILPHWAGRIEPSVDGEWLLHLHADEWVTDRDLRKLQDLLGALPQKTLGVRLVAGKPHANPTNRHEVRIHRLDASIDPMLAPAELDEKIAELGGTVLASEIEIQSLAVESQSKNRLRVPGPAAPAGGESRLSDTSRGVLIQLATGPHRELLELTRATHREYAVRHNLDYWCVEGNPAAPKRAGWAKVTLILSAMQMGFDRIVWLDADAVIRDRSVDISRAITAGIGMTQHPNPTHWNSGVIVVKTSAETRRFFEAVNAEPENDSAWMEQLPINRLAERPEFAGLLTALDPAFNSTPGAVVSPAPIVLAAHGLPHAERHRLLSSWVSEAHRDASASNSRAELVVRRREDFGELLNRLKLLGQAAEVGVLRGEYSRVLLDSWHGRTLHLIDPWRQLPGYRDIANLSDEEHERSLSEVMNRLRPHQGRFSLHRKLSLEAADDFCDGSLDFVYIDANHEQSAVASDIRAWFPKIRPGGVLAGHDYLDGVLPEGVFGVKSAVKAFEAEAGLVAHATEEPAWPSWYFIKPLRPGHDKAESQQNFHPSIATSRA